MNRAYHTARPNAATIFGQGPTLCANVRGKARRPGHATEPYNQAVINPNSMEMTVVTMNSARSEKR